MNNIQDLMTADSGRYNEKYGKDIDEVMGFLKDEYQEYNFNEQSVAWAIGKYSETQEHYAPFMEAGDTTTTGNLGDALKTNLGLAATQYATSIIPFLGSVQPTDQELAVIYYKRAVATVDRGGVKKGDELQNAFGKVNEDIDDYISDVQTASITIADKSKMGPYEVTLPGEVKAGTLNINVAGKITAIDDGKGHIFGTSINSDTSSINYDTGEVKITFTVLTNIVNNDKIEIVYTELLLGNDEIPGFKYQLKPESIPVRYWPLQVTYDVVADFVTKRRFGTAITDLAHKDLIYQVNKSVSFNAVKQLRAAAIKNEVALGGATTWSLTAPAGTSLIEHRRTFEDIYDLAITNMESSTGLGGVSAVITGSEGRKIYKSLGIKTKTAKPGVQVMGFQDGIPILYAPKEFMPKEEVLVIYKGDDLFEVPLVYSPFLPIMTVSTQGRDHNVFQNSVGVVHAAGLKVVNDGFCQRIRLA